MSSINMLLGWKDYLHLRPDRVRGDVEQFCARAQELRELVNDLLGAGLSEGAEQALADLCEADVTDFCILIDLAAQVDIPNVESLDADEAVVLSRFLGQEPWRSLAVDTDILVCLTMLRSYGEDPAARIWRMGDPHILSSISSAFDAVDREQLGRLVAEINLLYSKKSTNLDPELMALIIACSERAAQRHGLAPRPLFN